MSGDTVAEIAGKKEREAIVAWIADYAAQYERMVKELDKELVRAEREKCITTGIAFRFIQHAIERGDHLERAG